MQGPGEEEAKAVERYGSLGLTQQRGKWNQVKTTGKQQRRKIGRSCRETLEEGRKISRRDKDGAWRIEQLITRLQKSVSTEIIGKGWVRFGTDPLQMGKTEGKASGATLEGGGSHLNTKTRNAKEKILSLLCHPSLRLVSLGPATHFHWMWLLSADNGDWVTSRALSSSDH